MTAQIGDSLGIEDNWYSIKAVSDDGLFNPEDHDIQPGSFATCCHRNYHCFYQLVDGELHLKALTIGFLGEQLEQARHGKGPELLGLLPKKGSFLRGVGFFGEPYCYEDLPGIVPYTGRILLGRGHVSCRAGTVRTMLAFEDLRELQLEDGKLVSLQDLSSELRRLRESINDSTAQPTQGKKWPEVERWTEEHLSGYRFCH